MAAISFMSFPFWMKLASVPFTTAPNNLKHDEHTPSYIGYNDSHSSNDLIYSNTAVILIEQSQVYLYQEFIIL